MHEPLLRDAHTCAYVAAALSPPRAATELLITTTTSVGFFRLARAHNRARVAIALLIVIDALLSLYVS